MSRRCLNARDERPRAAHRRRRSPRAATSSSSWPPTLIRFDTTARDPGDPARDEAALQAHLGRAAARGGRRGRRLGAAPRGRARPPDARSSSTSTAARSCVARFAGAGGGRSLLLNGHIDVVSGEPKGRWTSDPNTPVVRDGNALRPRRVRHEGRRRGDGAGRRDARAPRRPARRRPARQHDHRRGVDGRRRASRASRTACAPTPASSPSRPRFDVWIACRGSVYPTITVEGRPGHAELLQPHWRDGGAVNAIEKAQIVLDAIRRLREEWRTRADLQHPLPLAARHRAHAHARGRVVGHLPGLVRRSRARCSSPRRWPTPRATARACAARSSDWIGRACAADPWLAEHPPTFDVDGRHPADGDPAGRPDRADGARRRAPTSASRRA